MQFMVHWSISQAISGIDKSNQQSRRHKPKVSVGSAKTASKAKYNDETKSGWNIKKQIALNAKVRAQQRQARDQKNIEDVFLKLIPSESKNAWDTISQKKPVLYDLCTKVVGLACDRQKTESVLQKQPLDKQESNKLRQRLNSLTDGIKKTEEKIEWEMALSALPTVSKKFCDPETATQKSDDAQGLSEEFMNLTVGTPALHNIFAKQCNIKADTNATTASTSSSVTPSSPNTWM